MIFDSKEQKNLTIALLKQVRQKVTLEELLNPPKELIELVQALNDAEVAEPKED